MRMLQELILLHIFSAAALAISANLRHHTAPQAQEIAKVAPNSQHYTFYMKIVKLKLKVQPMS